MSKKLTRKELKERKRAGWKKNESTDKKKKESTDDAKKIEELEKELKECHEEVIEKDKKISTLEGKIKF